MFSLKVLHLKFKKRKINAFWNEWILKWIFEMMTLRDDKTWVIKPAGVLVASTFHISHLTVIKIIFDEFCR